MPQNKEISEWVTAYSNRHQENQRCVSQETHIHRGTVAKDILKNILIPTISNDQSIKILEVGPGLDKGSVYCPYEPYRLASVPESFGHNYDMTIVDVSERVTADLLRRTKLVRSPQVSADDEKAWNEYLAETGQAEQKIHNPDPDLIFQDWVKPDLRDELLGLGFPTAQIPFGFKEKLKLGKLAVIRNDIAMVTPDNFPNAPFHLINAMNVLIYLNADGQKLAIDNFSRMLLPDGRIVVNDYEIIMLYMESLFKKQFHGWLTKKSLSEDFGLVIEGKPIENGGETTYILKKI
jgi:hypothetical protein